MVWFPNAKLNLGLRVLSKRPDGYHELSTCFYPIPFCDALEIIPRPNKTVDTFSFTGFTIPGIAQDNLCAKAIGFLRASHSFPAVEVHLHKAIPMGAGLGGGSSDAAFMLTALNSLFELGLDAQMLLDLALLLGSDCPFFIRNSPSMAAGRGEILTPVQLNLGGDYVVVFSPDIHISTAEAFKNVKYSNLEISPALLHSGRRMDWKVQLENDFEGFAFEKYPLLAKLKNQLYASGAYYAAMSGSGSSIFGLFDHQPRINFEKLGVRTFQTQLPSISVL